MSTPQQDADAIIASENITDAQPANEEPVAPAEGEKVETAVPDKGDPDNKPAEIPEESNDKPVDKGTDEKASPTDDGKPDDKENKDGQASSDTPPEPTPQLDTKSASETVQEAQGLIENLNLTKEQITDDKGNIKPWEEVVPAGAYLASQLEPVKVTDKDGKVHEFLLLDDVEKAFPGGFEAKNNIEQMRFQNAILGNETKFNEAVKIYNSAKEQYTKESNMLVQQQSDNARIAKEYRSMADQGLVPKIEGDPNDPKFLESPAVKELNKILEWQDAKNKELSSKGLGTINSVYVAKMMMDSESGQVLKDGKAKEIDKERKEVASLTSSPSPANEDGKAKPAPANVPMATYAEQIIAQEGLR